ncbi:tyrosine protein phosphatase [candidate division KSB3 bacterium]|uniref:protein-tyrosine-phosphatase n=1 Tax=candidate division KSB3 bacterium TaxID=2044937 RepID=A0A9D5Q5L2_9BACT|nr:tyrosine protein phosphatase [candidate division KSB3 bacterium]MBD3324944.1 tyrosine protein phosphatase [candidate division KSB3 bacterium]
MIDIHCHILPNLDDGPAQLEDALTLCSIAASDGITTIVATPHQQNGVYYNSSETILHQVEILTSELRKAKIALDILPGADVHIDVDTGEKILHGEILSVNNTKRYFLLEFPAHMIPPNIDKIIFDLLMKKITPILTHPERIFDVQENPNRIYDLVSQGVLSQITAMSLTGDFGRRSKKCAQTLLKHNLAHIIASDAHSTDSRPPILSRAVQAAARLLSEDRALEMVTTIPAKIIHGEPITNLAPPLPVERKRFWFFG